MFSFSELNLPLGYYIGLAFIFGLAIGSFLNVVIHRVPLGHPITLPASHCPHCQHKLPPYDNIPLLSFVLLRGRCRHCQERIAWRYPLVELLTALLFAVIVWHTGAEWWAVPQMAFGATMLALIFIDAQHQLLPDVITYPAFVAVLATRALHSGWHIASQPNLEMFDLPRRFGNDFMIGHAVLYGALMLALAAPAFVLLDWLDALLFDRFFVFEEEATDTGEPTETTEDELHTRRERARQRVIKAALLFGISLAALWGWLLYRGAPTHPLVYEQAYHALQDAWIGVLVGAGSIWFLRALYFLLRRVEGMGLGDVKMMAVVGGFLGWYGAFGVLLYGSILGAIAGLIIARFSKDGFDTALPFGVCLGAIAILAMLLG